MRFNNNLQQAINDYLLELDLSLKDVTFQVFGEAKRHLSKDEQQAVLRHLRFVWNEKRGNYEQTIRTN